MSLYIDPETGVLTTEYRRGLAEIRGYTPGVTCPAVVRCNVHGRCEPVGTINLPSPTQGGTAALEALARVAAAVTSGSRQAYLRVRTGVLQAARAALTPGTHSPDASGYSAILIAEAPMRALARYCDHVSRAIGHPWEDILRHTASMPAPTVRAASTAQRWVLHPDGTISDSGSGTVLPKRSCWITLPGTAGWELYDTFAPPGPPAIAVLLDDLFTLLVARSVESCYQYQHLSSTIGRETTPLRPGNRRDRLDGARMQQWLRDYAATVLRVASDTGWQVASALASLADL